MDTPTLLDTAFETFLFVGTGILYVLSSLTVIVLAWTAIYATFWILGAARDKTGSIHDAIYISWFLSGLSLLCAHIITTEAMMNTTRIPFPEVSAQCLPTLEFC